jgi:hypothetical protein
LKDALDGLLFAGRAPQVKLRYILALTCQYPVHDDTRVRGADGPHTGRTPGTCSNPQGWPP